MISLSPRAFELFNLIPRDIGRSLTDITNKLVEDDLLADAERVFATLHSVEREVATHEGRWYLMRLAPYRPPSTLSGVVI